MSNVDIAIQDLTSSEMDCVDGGKLSAAEVVTYALIGSAAIATGGVGCVVAGGFLLAMTGYLA